MRAIGFLLLSLGLAAAVPALAAETGEEEGAGPAATDPASSVAAAIAAPVAVTPEPAWRPAPAMQVRIIQRFSIRISPGAPMLPPDLLLELEQNGQNGPPPRYEERKLGKCLAIGNIAAVKAGKASRLLLFMRNQHIVSAALEKACRANEFYMGFYVAGNSDGQLCIDRDVLQSRSGASCKIKRLNELVEVDDRRFP